MVQTTSSPSSGIRSRLRDMAARSIALLHRERVTGADIVEAAFGTTHPNGITVTDPSNKIVTFKRYSEYKPSRRFENIITSAFYLTGTHSCFFPDYRFKSTPSTSLGFLIQHETAHFLQDVRKEEKGRIPEFLNEDDLSWSKLSLTQKFMRAATICVYDRIIPGVRKYLAQEKEMQARLHEIMAAGYAEWQKLPANKNELHAALYNIGLLTPGHIVRGLKATTEGRKALADFDCSYAVRSACFQRIQDLNAVYDYVQTDNLKNRIWQNAYPYMYGHLLELYGDRGGMSRMGLGIDRTPFAELARLLHDDPYAMTPQTIERIAGEMPAAQAPHIINYILHLAETADKKWVHPVNSIPPEDVRPYLRRTIKSWHENESVYASLRFCKKFLEREDVRNILNEDRTVTELWELRAPPIVTAALCDQGDFAALFAEAGLSLTTTYTVTGDALEFRTDPGRYNVEKLIEDYPVRFKSAALRMSYDRDWDIDLHWRCQVLRTICKFSPLIDLQDVPGGKSLRRVMDDAGVFNRIRGDVPAACPAPQSPAPSHLIPPIHLI